MKNLSETNYSSALQKVKELKAKFGNTWNAINPESAARMVTQNQFKTGLDIAKYTAAIMRKDMADYDADASNYTQSLGCWHGFVAQQKMIAVKKHHKTTSKRYLYLSGWMVAALRSEFGPLPDQSMHEKTAVPSLIAEIYDFLRQAYAIELNDLFRRLELGEEGVLDINIPLKQKKTFFSVYGNFIYLISLIFMLMLTRFAFISKNLK